MTEEEQKVDQLLVQLILSLQAGAMQQMGKIASPITGEIERDLRLAQATIDVIAMLETKMAGNLTAEETKLIGHVLHVLRLNYVDEVKKGEQRPSETKQASSAPGENAGGDEPEEQRDSKE